MSADSRPLSGIVVLDVTRVLAGPYCTRLLSDLGARVIKVERPGEGDTTRGNHLQLEPGRDDQSTYFQRVNAGKEGVSIALDRPEGQAVLVDLVARADVFIENFVPGVAAKLGCGYEQLRARTPGLIYCSISGFGQTGPGRLRPAFAHIVGAASGLMHLERGDFAARASNLQAADVLAATHALGAILAALWRRRRTGQGAHLDVSMLESMIGADDVTYGAVLNGGDEMGAPRIGMIVHRIGDRDLALQYVGAPQLWSRLTAVMRRPDLLTDPRYATPLARRERWREVHAMIHAWLDTFPTAEAALAALQAARLPSALVLAPAEVVALPHLAEREFFPEVTHATHGPVRITAAPFRLDGERLAPRGPAPYRRGEHTRAVLADLAGYAPERIDALRAAGVVEAP